MLEKPAAQNIAAYENKVKQHELSDHWKSIKMCLKKIMGWYKHDKKGWLKCKFYQKSFYILQNQI